MVFGFKEEFKAYLETVRRMKSPKAVYLYSLLEDFGFIIWKTSKQCGWKSKVCPVECGCRGFVGKSTIRLLKELGVRGQTLWQTIKALSVAAEEASKWIWVKRGDLQLGP